MPMRRLLVQISDSYFDKLDSVVEALSAKGFIPLKILRTIGVVIGEYPDKTIEKLERTPGVSVVVEDRKEFRLLQEQPHLTGRRNTKQAFRGDLFGSENLAGHSDTLRVDTHELIDKYTRFDGPVEEPARHSTYQATPPYGEHAVMFGARDAFLRKRYGR